MSNNNLNSGNSNRNGYIFPDFSLRRLLLQTRTGRVPYTPRACDVERGASNSGINSNGIANNSSKLDKKNGSTSCSVREVSANKVSFNKFSMHCMVHYSIRYSRFLLFILFRFRPHFFC